MRVASHCHWSLLASRSWSSFHQTLSALSRSLQSAYREPTCCGQRDELSRRSLRSPLAAAAQCPTKPEDRALADLIPIPPSQVSRTVWTVVERQGAKVEATRVTSARRATG